MKVEIASNEHKACKPKINPHIYNSKLKKKKKRTILRKDQCHKFNTIKEHEDIKKYFINDQSIK